jgi:superfamily II DNA or RNA helicase
MNKYLQHLKSTLRSKYRNGPDNIGRDFVSPCLKAAKLYRRGTGFFSSGALIAYADALNEMIEEKTKIEILCSPVVHDKTLLEVLENNLTVKQREETIQRLANNVILKALGYRMDTSRRDYKRDVLSYLIAKNIIEIKFAIPKNFKTLEEAEISNSSNLYHVKTGYFELTDGETVAFDGSFNESDSGHQYHIDQTQVWRSWVESDKERLSDLVETIDEDWTGSNEYLKIIPISEEVINLARKISPHDRPRRREAGQHQGSQAEVNPIPSKEGGLRAYQREALLKWKENGNKGIIALATGTGKTKTAIATVQNLCQADKNALTIVTAPYQPLAEQWVDELSRAGLSPIKVYDNRNSWESRVQNIISSHLSGANSHGGLPILVCVNKTFNGERFQNKLNEITRSEARRLLIVDECHHYNDADRIKYLPPSFNYRMGLSATPYESGEPRHLEKYFGAIVYEYPIARAIEENYLSPYKYYPLFIELSSIEARKYITLSEKIASKVKEDIEKSGQVLFEIEDLLDGVGAKVTKLEETLKGKPDKKYSLFYCGAGRHNIGTGEELRQVNTVTRLLGISGWQVAKITYEESNGERERILGAFRDGSIEALASIRVLDEGIDIPACKTAYILASQRSERQGIQRRGRLLRRAEDKPYAELYDFIISGPKLTNKQLDELYDKEIRRAKMFAADAINRDECMIAIQQLGA